MAQIEGRGQQLVQLLMSPTYPQCLLLGVTRHCLTSLELCGGIPPTKSLFYVFLIPRSLS